MDYFKLSVSLDSVPKSDIHDSTQYLLINGTNHSAVFIPETASIGQVGSLMKTVVLSITFSILILAAVIGNSFVIAAIKLERNLHNVANYLIVSLAIADLMVAVMVMPTAAVQEVVQKWPLGKIICDIWTSFDVLCCTASILHLVAIALDRYWAITSLDYGAKRTASRIVGMIALIWIVSTITAVTPHIFGLSFDPSSGDFCHLTDNLTYQFFSTLAAFYLPLFIMCIIYWKIFQAAKFRIRKREFQSRKSPAIQSRADSRRSEKQQKPLLKSSSEHLTACNHTIKSEKLSSSIYSTKLSLEGQRNKDADGSVNSRQGQSVLSGRKKSCWPIGKKAKLKAESRANEQDIPQADRSAEGLKDDSVVGNVSEVNLTYQPIAVDHHSQQNIGLVNLEEKIQKSVENHLTKKTDENQEAIENTESELPNAPYVHEKADIATCCSPERPEPSIVTHASSIKRPSINKILKKKAKIDIKRERKAAKTLGIIMSCFILCWLPFFLMQIMIAVCKDCHLVDYLAKSPLFVLLTWLGYLNSVLNPVIYTIFSPDFRNAFGKILFGKYKRKHRQNNFASKL
nr:G protein-coupled receptor [Proales similis]